MTTLSTSDRPTIVKGSALPAFFAWFGAAIMFGLGALVGIELTYSAWGDICDPIHQSPQTVLGIALATLSIAVPLAIAIGMKSRPVILIAFVASLFEAAIWWLLLSPSGVC